MSNINNPKEPANEPAAQTLSQVRVGQLVWVDFRHPYWDDSHETDRRLSEITHIDKRGRLYFCVPDPEYIGNFRYGFDPRTGVSPYNNYKGYVMRFATVESINAEMARIATENAAKEDAALKAVAIAKVRDAVPQLAQALVALHSLIGRKSTIYSDPNVAEWLRKADEALTDAGLM